jgi:hypothetical protein
MLVSEWYSQFTIWLDIQQKQQQSAVSQSQSIKAPETNQIQSNPIQSNPIQSNPIQSNQ